uniref:Uncharacterized protein n=1 Tax=Arundo donax TaxID=35708 RepID=A0A0A8YRZ7_ARUDO
MEAARRPPSGAAQRPQVARGWRRSAEALRWCRLGGGAGRATGPGAERPSLVAWAARRGPEARQRRGTV